MPEKHPAPRPASWFDAPAHPEGGCWLRHDHERLTYWACGHARRRDHERSPFLRCPPCAADRRIRRKYIAGHIALLVLQVVLLCLFAAGELR